MADPFLPKFVDLVRNTTTTVGTGNFVLGAAVAGFTGFTAACQVGDSFYYSAIGIDKPAEREVGRGMLQANGTVSRDPIGGIKTNFSSGSKSIALIAAAEWYGTVQQLVASVSRFPAALTDRSALSAHSATTTAYLREGGREGMFVWDPSNLSVNVAADPRQGMYIAGAADATGATGAWVRKFSGPVSVKWFGAVGDGTTNDGAAFLGALACLKSIAANYGNHYGGSPKLFIPAGHYYLATTTLDIRHTLVIEGEGSGRFGPGGGGCSRLRWADGSSGLRVQFPTTSAETTVAAASSDGAGGLYLKHLMLHGGYAGVENDHHGLVCRTIVTLDDVYIFNWPGEGIKGIAAQSGAYAAYGGNFSISCLKSVRVENCRIGYDIRGADANVVTVINCEAVWNRQAGFVDDAGIGSNSYISTHAASNGLAIDGQLPTQCTYAGHFYAVKIGREAAASTEAPSGTTADTATWLHIEPGSVDAAHPAWVTGLSWRWGGDYIVGISNAGVGVQLYNPYAEDGGFSQFGDRTVIHGGAFADRYYRGGYRIRPDVGALRILSTLALNGGIQIEDDNFGFLKIGRYSPGAGTAIITCSPSAVALVIASPDNSAGLYLENSKNTSLKDVDLASGKVLKANGVQVVGARQTGTPGDATDLPTALTLVNAMKAKLIAHGLIS